MAGLGPGVLGDLTRSRIFKSWRAEPRFPGEEQTLEIEARVGWAAPFTRWMKWAEQRVEAGQHTPLPSPLPSPTISTQGFTTAASTRNEHFYGNGGTFSLRLHW